MNTETSVRHWQTRKLSMQPGDKFNMLTVLELIPGSAYIKPQVKVRCDCGKEFVVQRDSVKRSNTKSCGCWNKEHKATRSVGTHFMSDTTEYHSWASMIQRCTNPNNEAYNDYGGRGITVHPSWLTFEGFIASMGKKPELTLSIDRKNNDGNYEPGNCRWATSVEQNNNRRDNVCRI